MTSALYKMAPLVIAAIGALLRRGGAARVAFDPPIDVVIVKLLAPEQTAQRLAHDILAVGARVFGNHRGVELIRFHAPLREQFIELAVECIQFARRTVAQAQAQSDRLAGRDCHLIVRRRFGAGRRRIDRMCGAVNDIVIDAVFDVGRCVVQAKEALRVGFVFGEEQRRFAFAVEPAVAVIVLHRV